jgi:hypothetical protein
LARIEGVSTKKASLIGKWLYFAVKRRMGRISEPWQTVAHVPRIHFGRAMFELMLDKSNQVPRRLRRLACVKTSMLVGCPT